MTKDEFEVKQAEWKHRLEDLMMEMAKFTNHQGKVVCEPPIVHVLDWMHDSIHIMRSSFKTQTKEEANA